MDSVSNIFKRNKGSFDGGGKVGSLLNRSEKIKIKMTNLARFKNPQNVFNPPDGSTRIKRLNGGERQF